MTVYVDDMKARFGKMIMCHMIADSDSELHGMAERLGVAREHHQAPPKHHSHYDISLSKRAEAIRLGAIEVSQTTLSCMCQYRRHFGILGSPEAAVRWRLGDAHADKLMQSQTPDLFS